MVRITINEVRKRLAAFSKQWEGAHSERGQAQPFWLRFYECFDIRAESATIYEKAVSKIEGGVGFIDSFIPGKLIIEHKSLGKSLDAAFDQAADYFLALSEAERPRYIITSDFARFRRYDLKENNQVECTLQELPKRADWFDFLLEDDAPEIVEESPADRAAAYQISRLHEALLRANFKGRDLENFLTRLLFCLFADSTGIFGQNGIFRRLVENTKSDGSDTGRVIAELFQVLNTPINERQNTLDEQLAAFEYINGKLFEEPSRIPSFDSDLRDKLLECMVLDWSEHQKSPYLAHQKRKLLTNPVLDWSSISPAIFGAMFQGVLEEHDPVALSRKATRRELGAHYTSERNILRVINPLFMDDLRGEFAKAKNSKLRLQALYDKLPTFKFLDPACGCGNFLVIAFRELRRLENDVIELLFGFDRKGKGLLDISHLSRVTVNQFYGIEIDESAAHIARVALWITDHQINMETAVRFGTTRPSVPLVDSPTIVCANALRTDWKAVIKPSECSFIMGNPPFVGYSYQTQTQKDDLEQVFGGAKGTGVLDYVAAWHITAARFIQDNTAIQVAFVSTNSLTQGEQPAVLWGELMKYQVQLNFAHRTFQWSNEGKGVAAVHCVILGFGKEPKKPRQIFDYENIKLEPTAVIVSDNINPYLINAPTVFLEKRRTPVCTDVPEMVKGSQPTDGGNLLLTLEEVKDIKATDPIAKKYIRPFLGAEEFINGVDRYCLWLNDSTATDRQQSPELRKRIKAVKEMRLASPKLPTQKLADVAYLFGEIRQTDKPYLLIPRVSSENRVYVPLGYFKPDVICGDANFMLPNATLYHFAVLTSTMHNAWMRTTCGRLKSDYRYSNTIVYNNYPWPSDITDKQKEAIEDAGKAVLDAREIEKNRGLKNGAVFSLANIYAPGNMPPELVKAHQRVDKAVDAAYGYKGGKEDAPRVAFLFDLYQQLTSLLPVEKSRGSRKSNI